MPIPIGIDFGNTNTVVAVCRQGAVETIRVDFSTTLPSVVSFLPGGDVLVGRAAKARMLVAPNETVTGVKRHIGDSEIEFPIHGRTYSPVDITAAILRKAVDAAEAYLGEKVSTAVITVPAYFTSRQNEDVRMAGEKAGIEVLMLLPEPTAAAIACGVEKATQQTLLVYHLGRTTFDVSVLKSQGNSFQVCGVSSDLHLGGNTFDERLCSWVRERFIEDTGTDLSQYSEPVLRLAHHRLLEAAEEAKMRLSVSVDTEIAIPDFLDGMPLECTITRDEYCALIRNDLEKTGSHIAEACLEAQVAPENIDRVILVGGSTRDPAVRELVAQRVKEPLVADRLGEMVAWGAARAAATLAVRRVLPPLVADAPSQREIPFDGTDSLCVAYSPYVFGIDFGTSNSSIAVSANDCVSVLKFMPSAVALRPYGEVVAGITAEHRSAVGPHKLVPSVKRHIGDPTWSIGIDDRDYSATEIAGTVIHRLVSAAQIDTSFDLLGTVQKVVICVPTSFTESQRQETIAAAEWANLRVLALLEEPTAAAIAFAAGRQVNQTILVYDLGGGTFDVSIFEVKSDPGGRVELRVLAKDGVSELGGDDFDGKLMEFAAAQLLSNSGIDIFDAYKDQGVSLRMLREAQQKLKGACETAKIELSAAQTTALIASDVLRDEDGKWHSIALDITRADFNAVIRPIVEKTIDAVRRALLSAAVCVDDISRVLLVGRSTRIPLVRQRLTETFGREPYCLDERDTVVGAAVYAAKLKDPDGPCIEVLE